jgi:hypothetical protein
MSRLSVSGLVSPGTSMAKAMFKVVVTASGRKLCFHNTWKGVQFISATFAFIAPPRPAPLRAAAQSKTPHAACTQSSSFLLHESFTPSAEIGIQIPITGLDVDKIWADQSTRHSRSAASTVFLRLPLWRDSKNQSSGLLLATILRTFIPHFNQSPMSSCASFNISPTNHHSLADLIAVAPMAA